MKSTNRATEFSKDLCTALKAHRYFTERIGVLKWVKNWPLPGNEHETVDVAGLRSEKSPVVIIEAELLREDPASNVVKIWKWAKDRNVKDALVFFQAFSKVYRRSKKERRERAKFLGVRMTDELRNARYMPIDFRYKPRPGGKVGAGRRRHHACLLAAQVERRWPRIRQS